MSLPPFGSSVLEPDLLRREKEAHMMLNRSRMEQVLDGRKKNKTNKRCIIAELYPEHGLIIMFTLTVQR